MSGERIKILKKLLNEYDNAHEELYAALGNYYASPEGKGKGFRDFSPEDKKHKKEIERDNAIMALRDFGITFDCGDYGGEYCLCRDGLKSVLKALKWN